MTGKDVNSIGLVGARGYELQAWQSAGANALEDAYWATLIPKKPATKELALAPKARLPLKSRVKRFIQGISGAAVMAATPR